MTGSLNGKTHHHQNVSADGTTAHAIKTEAEKKQEAFDLVLATIEALAEDRAEDEKSGGNVVTAVSG